MRVRGEEGRGREGREKARDGGQSDTVGGRPTRPNDSTSSKPCQPSRLLASIQLSRAAHRRHMRVVCGKRRGEGREGGGKEGSERGWGKRGPGEDAASADPFATTRTSAKEIVRMKDGRGREYVQY